MSCTTCWTKLNSTLLKMLSLHGYSGEASSVSRWIYIYFFNHSFCWAVKIKMNVPSVWRRQARRIGIAMRGCPALRRDAPSCAARHRPRAPAPSTGSCSRCRGSRSPTSCPTLSPNSSPDILASQRPAKGKCSRPTMSPRTKKGWGNLSR